jgi:hypothetical protein
MYKWVSTKNIFEIDMLNLTKVSTTSLHRMHPSSIMISPYWILREMPRDFIHPFWITMNSLLRSCQMSHIQQAWINHIMSRTHQTTRSITQMEKRTQLPPRISVAGFMYTKMLEVYWRHGSKPLTQKGFHGGSVASILHTWGLQICQVVYHK